MARRAATAIELAAIGAVLCLVGCGMQALRLDRDAGPVSDAVPADVQRDFGSQRDASADISTTSAGGAGAGGAGTSGAGGASGTGGAAGVAGAGGDAGAASA